MTLNVTMIRERCTIRDAALGNVGSHILSNRLALPMGAKTLVVRGQNMHSVARMAARLYVLYQENPKAKIDYSSVWQGVCDDVFVMNDLNWASVYVDGALQFASGDHHPFMDLIEKQVAMTEASYDMNVMITAENFNAAGFPGMSVEHNSNVALVFTTDAERTRCGLIYRHPQKTTTFSFAYNNDSISDVASTVAPTLEVSADFLESIQISYAVAFETTKGLAQNYERVDTLKARLNSMQRDINNFDRPLTIAYRPERPDFKRFLQEAQILLTKRSRG